MARLRPTRPRARGTQAVPPEEGHATAPLPQGRGVARTLSTSRSRPCSPPCAGLSRRRRQDASSFNQQTTDAGRHPPDFVESPVVSRDRASRPCPKPPGWPASVDTETFQPALCHLFMVDRGHDARSDPGAVACASNHFVVRSGPATGIRSSRARTPSSRLGEANDPRFQARITSPTRLPLSRSRTHRDALPKVSATIRRGARGS